MIILGLNAYERDSSACLVADGKLICAIAEERIRRIKHWVGLPTESVRWCVEYAGIGIKDVDHIAISSPDYSRTKRESWEVAENNAMRVVNLTTRDHRREKEREARTAARELRGLRAGEDELLPADARATARRGKLSMRGPQLRGGQDREPRKCRRQEAEYPRQGKGEWEPDKHATRRLRDQRSHF
jgi:hypothetical protein